MMAAVPKEVVGGDISREVVVGALLGEGDEGCDVVIFDL
jgi:hypothetical protein